ncbi:putative acetyltransferase [Lachnotalea glycerini]|uniref:Putative acetyltransferase n=1 Tax=Lachnotalea glycerini TaxID=1763509 RepID=A0A318ESQ8_9FIRM|nr:N-acetyltransferase [Lachnotalea glycerini]PXV91597.1 putative acetyltransferase [Lachnotalea glycerini]
MIRDFKAEDIEKIMKLWLDTNVSAHSFIENAYWKDNYEAVKEMLPQAKLFVVEQDGKLQGFIGLNQSYIAGIFVAEDSQSQGIGKQLLDYVKSKHKELSLQVYQKNERAVSFYLREGFTIILKQVDDNTGEAELVMKWIK